MLDWFYAPLVRPVLFSMDAEDAHERTLALLEQAPRFWGRLARMTGGAPDPSLAREVAGLRLAGPIGLAAGLDKDGRAATFWEHVGFGFVEVGTVTAHPQPGNPRPRLFRLPSEGALINRMGFNNHGSAALAERLRALRESDRWPSVPLGANIGKSKVTPLEDAASDYATSTARLQGLADYFTVNVSSPNTPGLRELQTREHMERILSQVLEEAKGTPVFVKYDPDMEESLLRDSLDHVVNLGVSGIIATNTTVRRDVLPEGLEHRDEGGGLSGLPLHPVSLARVGVVLDAVGGRVPVIGVGGIRTVEQAQAMLDAGCAAVQLYTGFIYEGPGLPSRLHRGLAAR